MNFFKNSIRKIFFRLGRGGFAQTVLSGIGYIAPKLNRFHSISIPFEFKTIDKHRFRGFYNKSNLETSKGLVILLHGWEGSSSSSYILKTGFSLQENGYEVFRLDFLDHGETHSWNEQIFHGNLLEEHFNAIEWICQNFGKNKKIHLVGFSLGGNYAIRVALKNQIKKIPNLIHTIAISPALSPEKATIWMDKSRFFGWYFLSKWMSSIDKKVEAFPDLFDFNDRKKYKSVMDLTDFIVKKTGRFEDASSYFKGYSIRTEDFLKIKSPITLITSQDDPIIPVEDFENLKRLEKERLLSVIILPNGGHNGFFIDSLTRPIYLKYINKILSS